MTVERPDDSQGWCCDGRTWAEHATEDGQCCQPQGKSIDELPDKAQQAARDRLDQSPES